MNGKPLIIKKYRPEYCKIIVDLFYDTVHTINARDYCKEQLNVWAPANINIESWNTSLLEHTTFIAEKNGVIVGFADMSGNTYLNRLYVHKNYQGRGIGTRLVKNLEYCAKEKNTYYVETHASITAKPFFERIGYTTVCENIVLRKNIELKNFKMIKKLSNKNI